MSGLTADLFVLYFEFAESAPTFQVWTGRRDESWPVQCHRIWRLGLPSGWAHGGSRTLLNGSGGQPDLTPVTRRPLRHAGPIERLGPREIEPSLFERVSAS